MNFITTIITMRAPGMTMFRMPIFTWNTLVTSILVLMAFPVLAAAILAAGADRIFGAHIYDPANGGVILWQHLFWFFGHPEVYIIALPFFGIVSEIFPVFSRKPIFGYKTLIYATIAIAALSVTVWAHHMYVTGSVLLPFFALMTMLIAVPTGVKIFNWIGTMWRGSITFETPLVWSIGFLVTFVFGGLTGVILASPPLDFHVSDTYFVVAHFHYVVFGTVVFAMFAGFYFWWPKWTGKMLNETPGQVALLAAVHRLPHDVPHPALARRRGDAPPVLLDYLPEDNFTWMNQFSTIGAVHPRRLADPVLPERVHHRAAGAEGDGERPVGLRCARSSGRRAARRRATTSRRSRVSARRRRRSTSTTPRRASRWASARRRTRRRRRSTTRRRRKSSKCAPMSSCSGSSPDSSPSSAALYAAWTRSTSTTRAWSRAGTVALT